MAYVWNIDPLTARGELDTLLLEVARKLELSPTQYERAESHYQAIGRVLEEAAQDTRTLIYPQGSMALRTPVKPHVDGDEYDVDLVQEFGIARNADPMALLDWVFDTLRANGTYRERVSKKKRCVRIDYAGEFHMDVLPAVTAPRPAGVAYGETAVLVPDRQIQGWSDSNPRGYIRWFDEQCAEPALLVKRDMAPLPGPDPAAYPATLRIIVQLVKRARDVWFQDDDDAVRSIVLTTLLAQAYAGDLGIYDALVKTVGRLRTWLHPTPIEVPNPTNPAELFSEQWVEKAEAYQKFHQWVRNLDARLHVLDGPDVDVVLRDLFGESVAQAARAGYARSVQALRPKLRASGRGLTTAAGVGTAVRQNRFFGGEDDS